MSVGTNSYRKTSTVQKHFAILAGLPHKEFLHSEIQTLFLGGLPAVCDGHGPRST